MASDPKFYDDADVLLAAAVVISATAGVAGTAVTLQVINDKGGGAADDFVGRMRIYVDDGSGNLIQEGAAWLDSHYLEIKQNVGGWNNNLPAGDWIKVGSGVPFTIPVLAADTGVEFDVRIFAPAGADEATQTIEPRLEESTAQATSVGISEAVGSGIYSGVRDRDVTVHVVGSDVLEDAPQSRDAKLPDAVYLAAGKVFSELARDETIAVAATGLERFDLIHLEADGTGYNRTVGSEVTAPAVDADKPALPVGDLSVCYVRVNDGVIEANVIQADIEQTWLTSYYDLEITTGRNVRIGPGPRALVANALTRNEAQQALSLTASVTSYIWLQRVGDLAVTEDDPDPPTSGALLLWEADTDGTDVTATRDRRHLIGHQRVEVNFDWPGEMLSTDLVRHAHVPAQRETWVAALRSVVASQGALAVGSGLGGATSWDIEVEGPATTWTSLFGTQPSIAFDASDPLVDAGAKPIKYDLGAGARLRCTATRPTGTITTGPLNSRVAMTVWV